MRISYLISIPTAFCLCCLVCAVSQAYLEVDLSQELQDSIEWFDTLGYPDLSTSPLVRVTTGNWTSKGGKPPVNSTILGFLLKTEGDEFSVLALDLSQPTFRKTDSQTPVHEQVDFERLDPKSEVNNICDEIENQAIKNEDFRERNFGKQVRASTSYFVLGRGLAAQGESGLAERIFAVSRAVATRDSFAKDRDELSRLQIDIGNATMWRSILKFEDPKISRREILRGIAGFFDRFPQSPHVDQAEFTCSLLERMIEEDDRHALKQAKAWEDMTTNEQIDELIFQLRDQNGRQWGQPGWGDIFLDDRGDESPASKLVQLGYDAVPKLIDAIDDDRFTRSVGFHRDFYFSHHVLTVGEAARTILQQISGMHFRSGDARTEEDQRDSFKSQIENWWRAAQIKGEAATLMEGVAKGDGESVSQGLRLLEKYPESALIPIQNGILSSSDWTRRDLIRLLEQIDSNDATDFLLLEMKQSPELGGRVSAATILSKRGKMREAMDAMMREWNEQPFEKRFHFESDLIDLFLSSRDPAVIRLLVSQFTERPIDFRVHLMLKMLQFIADEPHRAESPNSEVDKAIEEVLITALADTQARKGMSAMHYTNPRTCDIAGDALAMRFPEKYHFTHNATRALHDQQRIVAINVWRAENKLELVPVPLPRTVAKVPNDNVDALLTRYFSSRGETAKSNCLDELQRLGCGAIGRLEERLKEPIPPDDLTQLKRAAVNMANIVTHIQFDHDNVPIETDVEEWIEDFKGEPLRVDSLLNSFLRIAATLPFEAKGVELLLERAGDDTGIHLNVKFIPGNEKNSESQTGWSTSEQLGVGFKSVLASSGSSSYQYGISTDSLSELSESLTLALLSDPHEIVEMSVELVKQNDRGSDDD